MGGRNLQFGDTDDIEESQGRRESERGEEVCVLAAASREEGEQKEVPWMM